MADTARQSVARAPLPSPFATVRRLLSTKASWVVLVVLVVGLLSFGSVHNTDARSATQRINDLESVIKCPPCADISIAQSDDEQAKTLRASVVKWVHEGWSDTRIENEAVALYGPNELLRPHTTGVDILVWIVPVIAIILGGVGIAFVLFRRKKKVEVSGDLAIDELLVALARDDKSRDS